MTTTFEHSDRQHLNSRYTGNTIATRTQIRTSHRPTDTQPDHPKRFDPEIDAPAAHGGGDDMFITVLAIGILLIALFLAVTASWATGHRPRRTRFGVAISGTAAVNIVLLTSSTHHTTARVITFIASIALVVAVNRWAHQLRINNRNAHHHPN